MLSHEGFPLCPHPRLIKQRLFMAPEEVPSNLFESSKLPSVWITRLTNQVRRFSISQKIGSGYALALGIAVMVTCAGQLVGNYYQQQARSQLENAQKDSQRLSHLQVSILSVRSHQYEIISLLKQPKELQAEYLELSEEMDTVKNLLAELKSAPHTSTTQDLKPLLPAYNSTVEEYNSTFKALIRQIQPLTESPNQNLDTAQKLLQNFISSTTALKFNYLSYRLTGFIKTAYQQQEEANQAFDQAEKLRILIIIFSTLSAIIIAAFLAVYTSRLIARPLVEVTQIAQRVTQEANFTLKVPVTTDDEVGTLATSLNQLIQWVSEYTHQLEAAHETLEQRVAERTEELSQKHQQLEQAHQQISDVLQNLQKTQSQLIQTEKMSSLGQMVAGVAHEINNPVNFIRGNMDYVNNYTTDLLNLIKIYQQQYPQKNEAIQNELESIDLDFLLEDLPQILHSMKTGVERICQIVLSLRNFSRLDESEIKSTNIHEGIDSTLLILNHRLKQGVKIIKQYGDLPLVECYPAQLNQVFMNIINNAIDALLEQDSGKERQIVIQTEILDQHSVDIHIRDNGPGISQEIQSKLFDPFFTTKSIGKGTGLGLSICYQIVEKHQGKVRVSSEPGQGTEFEIMLPTKLSALKS